MRTRLIARETQMLRKVLKYVMNLGAKDTAIHQSNPIAKEIAKLINIISKVLSSLHFSLSPDF